jgi:hypothetical protein
MKYYIYASKLDLNFKATVMRIIAGMGREIDLSPAERRSAADFTIRLVPRVYLDNFHTKKEFYPASGKEIRFSFTVDDTRIYIDGTNWKQGVPESGLSRTAYRTYVIQHEVGHALGHRHKKCNWVTATGRKCPVMYQMTRGPPIGFHGVDLKGAY